MTLVVAVGEISFKMKLLRATAPLCIELNPIKFDFELAYQSQAKNHVRVYDAGGGGGEISFKMKLSRATAPLNPFD